MKIIKIFFQSLFKKFFQLLFKIFYGKIIYEKNNLKHKNILINKVKNKEVKKFNKNPYYVYSISNGRIYTDQVENLAVINENKILDNISYQQQFGRLKKANKNVVLEKGTPRIKKKISSNLMILSQGGSGIDNYFHWLFDILPKIKICSEIYNIKKIDYFYLTKLKKFQKEILNLLGIKKIRILDSNLYRHVQAKKIIAVTHPWYEKGFILEEVNKMPKWIVLWLRKIFLSKALKFKSNKKIFIDRSESKFNHCKIINDDEVSSYLNSKGFSKYKVGQLSFRKQIHLFKNAKTIIGPHGAAFANLIFCKAKTKVIEIKPKKHKNFINKKISEYLNLDYTLIETPIKKKVDPKGDILINMKNLKKII